jgi:DNA-binding MarR family transcriptional regulator
MIGYFHIGKIVNWKQMASNTSPAFDPDELFGILAAFMRYRRHVMAMLPEDIAQLKERVENIHIRDRSKPSSFDHDFIYRIAVSILSRYQGPMPMGELGKALDVPLSTATRIVDGLVDAGVVQRVADPEDRRVVRVTLTEEGRKLNQIMNEYMQQRIDEVLGLFSDEERTQLKILLLKIAGNLNTITK